MRRIAAVAIAVFWSALVAQEPLPQSVDALRAAVEHAEGLVKEGKLPEAREGVRVAWEMAKGMGEAVEGEEGMGLVWRVAEAADSCGDLRTAHDGFAAIEAFRARTLPDDHPDLQMVRGNLAITKHRLGDLRGALVLQEKALQMLSQLLPDDHPVLQLARQNLAGTRKQLGDLHGAQVLEEKVFEVRSRLLPDDHPDLQVARHNLAVTKAWLGDVRGALPLVEKVLGVYSRLLPDEHPDLQTARQTLASIMRTLGDLRGALALEEKVFEVRSRLLPDDHPGLQLIRTNLALTKKELGDLPGALALEEKVFETRSRLLPEEHPALQSVRHNLAVTKRELGDLDGALRLLEKAYEVRSRLLRDDHPDLQRTRGDLANSKRSLGDLRGALELDVKVLEVWSRLLPDDDPDLQSARQNLAATKFRFGDLRNAVMLLEKVFEVRSRRLPVYHPDLQSARLNLIWTDAALNGGQLLATHELVQQASSAVRNALAHSVLAPRGLAKLAESMKASTVSDNLGSLVTGCDTLPPAPHLAVPLLLMIETLRGIETRSVRLLQHPALGDARRIQVTALSEQAHTASDQIAAITGEIPKEGEDREAWARVRVQRHAEAVLRKEKLERQILETLQPARGYEPTTVTTADMCAQLPEGAAAVSVLAYTHTSVRLDALHQSTEQRRALALCLQRDGEVCSVALGLLAPIEAAVARIRRGVGADVPAPTEPGQGSPLVALRKLVMDPILASLPDARTLYLSFDESLQLVPLDALPDDQGNPIGARVQLRQLVSLFELLEREAAIDLDATAGLVAFGGIDFAGRDEGPAAPRLDAFAPVTSERSGEGGAFLSLAGSSAEVDAIGALFAQAIPDGKAQVHKAKAATKGQLFAAATGARYLHLATHGYFAPEWVRSSADPTTDAMDPLREHRGATGLSPLVLAGLALAGANLPADALGRHEGIATAEELLHLDLRNCELVTLSACDSSLGVRRAGQGYASLRAALLGAGARRVVASLWRVDDAVTRDLMVDFYRRLWVEKKTPHAALWEARMAVRAKHPAFRHWAGWVLIGK